MKASILVLFLLAMLFATSAIPASAQEPGKVSIRFQTELNSALLNVNYSDSVKLMIWNQSSVPITEISATISYRGIIYSAWNFGTRFPNNWDARKDWWTLPPYILDSNKSYVRKQIRFTTNNGINLVPSPEFAFWKMDINQFYPQQAFAGDTISFILHITSINNVPCDITKIGYYRFYNGPGPFNGVTDLNNHRSEVAVIPMPATQFIKIKCDAPITNPGASLTLRVYNSIGEEMIQLKGDCEFNLDLSTWPEGNYTYRVSGDNFFAPGSFIKLK